MVAMAKPKKKPGEKKQTRTGRALNVWIRDDVMDALDRYIGAQRFPPGKTAVVEALLAEFLEREGFLGDGAKAEGE